jgi:hypothetical protein
MILGADHRPRDFTPHVGQLEQLLVCDVHSSLVPGMAAA